MGEISISINNVSKRYQRYTSPADRLKELVLRKNYAQQFWALKNVSFEIEKGETFGIIGRNGSGKSTLLQIIAGTLTPTEGQVKVHGRVAALLELGSGFNPEFTGKQNIFFNGRLLGLTKEEIVAKFDEIVAFADIGNFLDEPVKTYSSGMVVRLAFAVQAHLSPDILIVDEALSVGDIFFQQKCSNYLEKLRQQGVTLLLVSHDMNVMQTLCRRAILLHQGEMLYSGTTNEAISKYYSLGSLKHPFVTKKDAEVAVSQENLLNATEFLAKCQWIYEQPQTEADSLKAKILGVRFQDEQGQDSLSFRMGDRMVVHLLAEGCNGSVSPEITVTIRNRFDQVIFCGGSYLQGVEPPKINKNQQVLCKISLEMGIEAGEYTFEFSVGEPLVSEPNVGVLFHQTSRIGPVLIQWEYVHKKAPFLGAFNLPCIVQYQSLT